MTPMSTLQNQNNVTVDEAAIDDALAIIKSTILKKNADYGNAWQRHGLPQVLTRLCEKSLRLETLSDGRQALVTNESTLDTLIDIGGYGVLGIIYAIQNGIGGDRPA
jgi:hypothetical protein